MKIFDWLFDRKGETVKDTNEDIVNDSDKVCMIGGFPVGNIIRVILCLFGFFLYLKFARAHLF